MYQAHGACFNLGEDAEGNTLISWSALHALYTLPDGGIWAEHSDFVDHSDLVRLAAFSLVPRSSKPPMFDHHCTNASVFALVQNHRAHATGDMLMQHRLVAACGKLRVQMGR